MNSQKKTNVDDKKETKLKRENAEGMTKEQQLKLYLIRFYLEKEKIQKYRCKTEKKTIDRKNEKTQNFEMGWKK